MENIFFQKCSDLGRDIRAIQGAGGNVSIKKDGLMHIKASGTWLSQASAANIFVTVPVDAVLTMLQDGKSNFQDLVPVGSLRPSVETPLHALLPHPVVIHAHCVDTIARSLRPSCHADFSERMTGVRWSMVGYSRPGLPLANAVKSVLLNNRVDVLVLNNHGLIVGGDTVDEAFARFEEIRSALELTPRDCTVAADEAFLENVNDAGWNIPTSAAWHALATDRQSFGVACRGPYYPDHVVFLGGIIPAAQGRESLSRALARYEQQAGFKPKYMLYEGMGMLVEDNLEPGVAAMLDALALVCARLDPTEDLCSLSVEDVAALLNWDAEKYRRTLAGGTN